MTTESKLKTAYINWKQLCLCTITKVFFFRESFLLSTT